MLGKVDKLNFQIWRCNEPFSWTGTGRQENPMMPKVFVFVVPKINQNLFLKNVQSPLKPCGHDERELEWTGLLTSLPTSAVPRRCLRDSEEEPATRRLHYGA